MRANGTFDSSHDPMPAERAEGAEVQFVNAYAVTRNYGGPEEGGWWYDSGEPLASIPCISDEEISAALDQIKRILGPDYAGRRTRYSVIGDTNIVTSIEDAFAASWPAEVPHYE